MNSIVAQEQSNTSTMSNIGARLQVNLNTTLGVD